MTIVKAFKAIRPASDKVHLVASRSVDTYSPAELKLKLAENPYTFLHIIKPSFAKGENIPYGSKAYLQRIKQTFQEYRKENILIEEQKPALYIYRQIKPDVTFTGIIACASIDDYLSGKIKIHEQTLSKKEGLLKDYLETCDFNAEPVNLTYPQDSEIDGIIEDFTIDQHPVYDFTTTDRLRHQVWKLDEPYLINKVAARFAAIGSAYIADGHHRTASSALLGKWKREKLKNYTGKEGFNYFLAAFFPDNNLKIYDYNRLVKDLNGLGKEQFLQKLEENFTLKKGNPEDPAPKQLHDIGMYLDGNWYLLTAKKDILTKDPVGTLDASILTTFILDPVLDLKDLRNDKRIAFMSGLKGTKGLQEAVDTGKATVAFALFPVSVEQLKHIADTGNTMPPKTTWIEPKLRSGLLIFNLQEQLE